MGVVMVVIMCLAMMGAMMGSGKMMGGGMEGGVPNEQWRGREALPSADTKASTPRNSLEHRGAAPQGDTEHDEHR